MIRHLIAVLLVPTSASADGSPPSLTDVLTLEQAVALALENNRTIRNAELEVSKADDRLAVAHTQRLPSFKVNAFSSLLLQPVDFLFKQGFL